MSVTVSLEVSPRYFVLGAYKDRDTSTLRIYPCPFVRITIAIKTKEV